jgi:hypothetical protein
MTGAPKFSRKRVGSLLNALSFWIAFRRAWERWGRKF